MAEDQDANPWEALHVERGFEPDDTVVTVTGVTAPMSVATGSGYSPIEDVLYLLADSIVTLGSNNITGGDMVYVLGPMTAKALGDAGYTKQQVKEGVMKLATRPVREVKSRRSISPTHPMHWSKVADEHDDEARVPWVREPGNLTIVVSGGWGSGAGFCALCAGWGALGGYTQSKKVEFPNPNL